MLINIPHIINIKCHEIIKHNDSKYEIRIRLYTDKDFHTIQLYTEHRPKFGDFQYLSEKTLKEYNEENKQSQS